VPVNRSATIPTRPALDMLRATVEEALAPLADRLDGLERGILAQRSPALPLRETHDMLRATVEEALAPLRNRQDDLERGMLEAFARIAHAPVADAKPDADRAGERERGRILFVMAALVVVNVATLVGVFAHVR
jgi:hypothetical protein